MFSQEIYELGLQIIRTVQTVKSEPLTFFMKAVSFLSDPKAYTLFLPFIFLCVDEKRGMKLAMSVFFAASVNTGLKNILKVPRPYIRDASVGLDSVHGYSTPSGHSQSSAAFWPYLVYLFARRGKNADTAGSTNTEKNKRRRALKLLCAVGLPLLIGFSRVYLGVHYPSDVLLGWILGFLISCGLILFDFRIESFIRTLPRGFKILIPALICAALNAFSPADTSMNAAFFGFGLAYIFLKQTGGFCASRGTVMQKILRLCIAAALFFPLGIGLKAVFPGKGSEYYQLFRFVRYLLLAFLAGFIIPKLCILLKCARPSSECKA
ncbi:phosphatase PAP2 family protein [Treponema sp. HNW]|uniref:phosphatase PAP2 family protein n=1 Tax=Treponema sp. HNW TaxID=3116654 RepID=UPI003D0F74D2